MLNLTYSLICDASHSATANKWIPFTKRESEKRKTKHSINKNALIYTTMKYIHKSIKSNYNYNINPEQKFKKKTTTTTTNYSNNKYNRKLDKIVSGRERERERVLFVRSRIFPDFHFCSVYQISYFRFWVVVCVL